MDLKIQIRDTKHAHELLNDGYFIADSYLRYGRGTFKYGDLLIYCHACFSPAIVISEERLHTDLTCRGGYKATLNYTTSEGTVDYKDDEILIPKRDASPRYRNLKIKKDIKEYLDNESEENIQELQDYCLELGFYKMKRSPYERYLQMQHRRGY